MSQEKIGLAITPGAENGVGPELMLRALNQLFNSADSNLYLSQQKFNIHWCGDLASLILASERSNTPLKFTLNNQAIISENLIINYQADLINNLNILERQSEFIKISVKLANLGRIKAIISAPIEKEALSYLGPNLAGQTEYFSQELGYPGQAPLMTFWGGPCVMSLLSTHLPIAEVSKAISANKIYEHIKLLANKLAPSLKKSPKDLNIIVLGLNPHAGEHGLIGHEEIEEIIPGIKLAQRAGYQVSGPMPADGFFAYWHELKNYPDAIIACYHDQGLIAYKLLARGEAVNVTLGLKIPRTSPAHGTASNLVGTGFACIKSSLNAINLAIKLAN